MAALSRTATPSARRARASSARSHASSASATAATVSPPFATAAVARPRLSSSASSREDFELNFHHSTSWHLASGSWQLRGRPGGLVLLTTGPAWTSGDGKPDRVACGHMREHFFLRFRVSAAATWLRTPSTAIANASTTL
eukprot:Amastigsp_a1203_22.p5 type:complete len:140 gc:universal Amastigsp_a1203_22:1133-1552(+)